MDKQMLDAYAPAWVSVAGQASLRLIWSQTPEDRFSHDMVLLDQALWSSQQTDSQNCRYFPGINENKILFSYFLK